MTLAFLTLLALAVESPALPVEEVARIATVMVDGELAKRIQTPRSLALMVSQNLREPWEASDNYEVDHASFVSMKKTLIRLSRLCALPCDANLWIPLPTQPARIHVAVRNVNEMSQFWPWGSLSQDMPPEMKQVLETGKRVTVQKRPGMTSVLAPVYDSLGDVAAIVEVVTMARPDPRENVK